MIPGGASFSQLNKGVKNAVVESTRLVKCRLVTKTKEGSGEVIQTAPMPEKQRHDIGRRCKVVAAKGPAQGQYPKTVKLCEAGGVGGGQVGESEGEWQQGCEVVIMMIEWCGGQSRA